MKHADFVSLDIETVLNTVLDWVVARTDARRVAWLSHAGFKWVDQVQAEGAAWQFPTAEIIGRHWLERPQGRPELAWAEWRDVGQLYVNLGAEVGPRMIGGGRVVYPIRFGDRFEGMLLIEGAGETNPVALLNSLRAGLELASKYIHFGYLHLAARDESYLDELTGLYNQRYLPMALAHEIERAKRESVSFTLLFLDVDYFKMVNDGRGHLVGSRLLIALGKVLRDQVRACDYCFRYGGDEFIVLLSNAGPESALKVAERIRRAVEQTTYHVEGHNLNLTVSIGLASYPEHAGDAAGLIHIADQAMYHGKRKSRNIVFVAS